MDYSGYKDKSTFPEPLIEVYNMDCMELLRQTPDNHYSLCICDPPYGIDCGDQRRQKSRTKLAKTKEYHYSGWDKDAVSKYVLAEIIRVSKNQIIWGANHFISKIPYDSSCWIVWDKDNSGDFADCELAYTSFKTAVRKFKFRWNGMIQENMKNKEIRIHPTQKPVALYKWLLRNYAKEGDKILDSHMGSGSIAIACHYMGFNLTACELDEDYYKAACGLIDRETAQKTLF